MLVYRAMSGKEIVRKIYVLEASSVSTSTYGGNNSSNTFMYPKDKRVIHFFKYPAHAFNFINNVDASKVAVAKVKLDIIPTYEYGYYSGITTSDDSSLYSYRIPLPEIILEEEKVKDFPILDFSNGIIDHFEFDENGTPEFFCIEQGPESQVWTSSDVYYEYIKSLLPRFGHDYLKMAMFLKSINLDDELDKMTEHIKRARLITKK